MDSFTRASLKILVVEDEPILAENIAAYLSVLSGEVRVAGDGASAIAIIRGGNFAPDLLVLDYGLPDMSGFELFDAIRQGGCRCRCVLITAHPGLNIKEDACRHGIAHVLGKPFSLADLAALTLRPVYGRR